MNESKRVNQEVINWIEGTPLGFEVYSVVSFPPHMHENVLERLIPFNGIEVITDSKATAYDGKTLTVQSPEGERELPCDSVIMAVGYEADNTLYKELEFDIPELYLLGDAGKVANIMYAIWDAFEVASHI